ncbi:hypothetical protein ACW9HQ_48810 [Nocardia gipuzkoensis]
MSDKGPRLIESSEIRQFAVELEAEGFELHGRSAYGVAALVLGYGTERGTQSGIDAALKIDAVMSAAHDVISRLHREV